jgi:hypothetical protein
MGWLTGMFSKAGEIIFPNTAEGVASAITEYRDPLGKVVKVSIDIIPTVATSIGGPLVGAATGTLTSGVKAAKAIYTHMTSPAPKHPQKKKRRQTRKTTIASAQSGAFLLETTMKLVREGVKGTPDASVAPLKEISGHLDLTTTAIKAGAKQAAAVMTVKAAKKIITAHSAKAPDVLVNLYGGAKGPVSTLLHWSDLVNNARTLVQAFREYVNIRDLNKAAKAAISLIHQEDAEKAAARRKPTKKGKVTAAHKDKISSKKAVKLILQHKKDSKRITH